MQYSGKGTGKNCTLIEPTVFGGCKAGVADGKISGYKSVGTGKPGSPGTGATEAQLQSALQLGPVAINMFADKHMAHYKSGVLSYSNCSDGTNHGVLAVGYGSGVGEHCASRVLFAAAVCSCIGF